MKIIDDLAAKNINQPVSIKFLNLVRKITKDPREFFTKLATIPTLTSINFNSTAMTPSYEEIQPLLASRQILDLGMHVNDHQIIEMSPQLTRLILKSNVTPIALAASIDLRDLDYFTFVDSDVYKALPNPAALTKLTYRLFSIEGHDITPLDRFINLNDLTISSWNTFNMLPHSLPLLPNLESLNIGLKMDMESVSKNTNLTSLKLPHHPPTHVTCISKLTNLQELQIQANSWRVQCQLECLKSLQLKSVTLSGTYGEALVNCLNVDHLVRLRIEIPYDSPYRNNLPRLTGLEELYLESPHTKRLKSCPRYFVDVANLTRLTSLEVHTAQMQCNHLETLTTLQHLHLDSSVVPKGRIGPLVNLTYLHIKSKGIEDCDLISKLTKLQHLICPALKVKDDMLLSLTNLTKLTIANVTSVDQIQLPNLQQLKIRQRMDPGVFLSLSRLTTLDYLSACSSVVTDPILQGHPFVVMTNLQNIVQRSPVYAVTALNNLVINALPLLCTGGG